MSSHAESPQPNTLRQQHLVAGLLAAVYLVICWTSRSAQPTLTLYLAGHFAAGFGLLAYRCFLQRRNQGMNLRLVVLWAVVFRLIGLFGYPLFEDDQYRFLLDGCLFWQFGSPYGVTPEWVLEQRDLPEQCRRLSLLVNYPQLATIYPPVMQGVFALAYWLSPANITALQALLVLCDLALILLLCRRVRAANVMLYAWCPLAFKEIALSAHPDIIGLAFLFAALFCMAGKRTRMAAIFSAAACAGKIFAWLIVPFILLQLTLRERLIFGLTLAAFYLPFFIRGATEFATLGIFAAQWEFNSSLFLVARTLLPDQAARWVCLGLFGIVWLSIFNRYRLTAALTGQWSMPPGVAIFTAFFLLSPVVNPWYLLWLLPFAAMQHQLWPWVWAVSVALTYVVGVNLIESELAAYEIARWAYLLQFGLLSSAMLLDRLLIGRRAA